MGRATASRLAAAGCRLFLVDLEQAALDSVVRDLGPNAEALPCATDISDRLAVSRMVGAVEARFGRVDMLVNAAGTNTRERTLAELSPEQWARIIAVNLTGVFLCIQAFLDLMRRGGGGVVVNIVSTVARLVSPGAGSHYCAAKRALLSLTESVNIEQGRHGIRACAISPGEVDTPLVDRRPEPPSPERRAAMLRPGDVAEAIHYVVTRPARVTIGEIVIWPSAQVSGIFIV